MKLFKTIFGDFSIIIIETTFEGILRIHHFSSFGM